MRVEFKAVLSLNLTDSVYKITLHHAIIVDISYVLSFNYSIFPIGVMIMLQSPQ